MRCRVLRRITPPPTVGNAICLGDGITPTSCLHLPIAVLFFPEGSSGGYTALTGLPDYSPAPRGTRHDSGIEGPPRATWGPSHPVGIVCTPAGATPLYQPGATASISSRKQPAQHSRTGSALRLSQNGPRMLAPLLAWWQSSILPSPCM